jgi:hypothetical protein
MSFISKSSVIQLILVEFRTLLSSDWTTFSRYVLKLLLLHLLKDIFQAGYFNVGNEPSFQVKPD